MGQLQEKIEEIIDKPSEEAEWSVTAIDENTGVPIVEINQDRPHPAASLAKLAIAHILDKQMLSNSNLVWRRPEVRSELKAAGTGVLQYFPDNFRVPFPDLVYLMLAESDTTAAKMLAREMGGPHAINEALAASDLELEITRLEPVDKDRFYFGETTGDEIARIFSAVVKNGLFRDVLYMSHCQYGLRGDIENRQASRHHWYKLAKILRGKGPDSFYKKLLKLWNSPSLYPEKEGSLEGSRHDVARVGSIVVAALSSNHPEHLGYGPEHPAHHTHRKIGKAVLLDQTELTTPFEL